MSTAMRATVFRGTPRNLARLASALRRGELVGVPTETVYGLAGDALNPQACRAIFRAKGRPSNDPLIVHIASLRQLDGLAERNEAVEKVAAAFWPGPLTLVLPKRSVVPGIVTSGRPSVAMRMPRHPLFRKLLRASGLALAAPSANPFGYISPTTAEHVRQGLGNKIRYILDGGPCEIGLESTILDLRNPRRPTLLRPGAIERADLERALGRRVFTAPLQTPARKRGALAPGMLSKHYSPKTPLRLHRSISLAQVAQAGEDEAFLFIARPSDRAPTVKPDSAMQWLSAKGDLHEAAHALFAALRRLDREGWKRIHAELAPGKSALALAINDRLGRAAAKR